MRSVQTVGRHQKLLLCFVFLWIALYGVSAFAKLPVITAEKVAIEDPAVVTPVIAKVKVGVPVNLKIPTISVNAPIIPEGVTPEGNMDVPNNLIEVGWYKLGPKPGDKGNSVLDGHVMYSDAAGVFANLNKLVAGDTIYVLDDKGVEREFKVSHTKLLNYKETILDEVFGPTTEYHLNIITCAGNWIPEAQTFDQRLIVFSVAVD